MLQASRLRSRLAAGVSTAAILGLATPALAQQQSPDSNATIIEEIVVTAQKREEALQDVPIAVSAFTQEGLEAQGIEGGPDLQLSVPNVSFSRGNFTGYNFQIRGVGSKLVAASGDAGVGIHLNNAPLVANRLFEAEFYDVERVEVLRGPQGTLYGRNATGGVVNVITAKPTDVFEGNIRAEYGNYNTRRLRGAVNLPINDLFALRVAGSLLKRDGFGENLVTGNDVDDRDLYAFRATLGFNQGGDGARAFLLYEHFNEEDNRARVGKQLCRKDVGPASVGGVPLLNTPAGNLARGFLSQGCLPSGINDPISLGTLNSSATLGGGLGNLIGLISGDAYAGKVQNPDLRTIESAFDPEYRATSDVFELNLEIDISENLTLSSLSSYNQDEIFTFQDYNRIVPNSGFNATPLTPGGIFNDPQLGQSNQFRTFDISSGYSEQFSQEFRLSSAYDGPFNFNVGVIYVNFDTQGDYYVFSNTLTAAAAAGIGTNPVTGETAYVDPSGVPPVGDGHNYFRSFQPYHLESQAAFGEFYYEPIEDLKFTLGLRYTKDEKEAETYQTKLLTPGRGIGEVTLQEVSFKETTGRFGVDWQPDLGFTDDTLLYASYSRGYKAGGFNPPTATGVAGVAPLFAPEFVNSIEIGTKNTLLNGSLQLNVTGFNYDYEGYQISRIVNRTSINDNIDAKIRGLEVEALWEPINNLRFNMNLGLIKSEIEGGSIIDVFDRTQGNAGLTVVKGANFSNCVAPTAGIATLVAIIQGLPGTPNIPGVTGVGSSILGVCDGAFAALGLARGVDGTLNTVNEGIAQNLDGNELPNTPQQTLSLGAQYTLEFADTWNAVARVDYYYQAEAFTRIYNREFDRLDSYDNVNLNLQINNDRLGLTIEAFVRNATDEEAITDAYLTDDSSGLFRNLFLTEPRTYGVAVSKSF